MTSNPQLEAEALAFAYRCHDGQTRKNSDIPYIIHPVRVGLLVKATLDASPAALVPGIVGGSCSRSDIVAAAYLHDVAEDCGTVCADFEQEFGYYTGKHLWELVKQVTEVSRPEHGNRKARRQLDADHYARSSPAGATIKLADVIDNAVDISCFQPKFQALYRAEMQDLVPRLCHGHPTLYARAAVAVGIRA